MRSLLALLVLVLTCAPASTPAPSQPVAGGRPAAMVAPRWTATTPVSPSSSGPRTLVVHLDPRGPQDPEAPWSSREHDAFDIDSHELLQLLTPPPDAWPDRGPSVPLREALCAGAIDCEDEDLDEDALWAPVLDAAAEAGLLDAPPGTTGDPWDRYTTLWITYTQSGGFFMDADVRDELDRGILLTLDATPEGPLRGPLALATLLMADVDEELKTELLWELLEEHEGTMAIIGMDGLAERGVPPSAFDDLELEEDLDLFRRRLHVEEAFVSGDDDRLASALASLAAHPGATTNDRLDADELTLALGAGAPTAEWEQALAEEIRGCADVAAGDRASVEVTAGHWNTTGDGATADCLFGWTWHGEVADQRVELRVIR